MSYKVVLESEGAEEVAPVDAEAAAEVAVQAEVGAGEVEAAEGSVSDIDTGIEDAVDTVEDLGKVEEVLQGAVDSGEGLDAPAAELAEIAIEAICARVGLDAKKARIIPALESFGSTNSRLTATKIALESVQETAQRIWKAIKAAAVAAWNAVKNFFVGLVKNRGLMEGHLKNLKKRAEAIDAAAKPAKATFSVGAQAFSVDGKADAGTAVKVLDNSKTVLNAGLKAGELGIKTANAIANAPDTLGTEISNALKSLGEATGQWAKGSTTDKDNMSYYGQLVGRRAIAVKKDGDKLVSIGVAVAPGEGAKEATAPSKAEIGQVVDAALVTLAALKDYEKVQKQVEGISKAATNYADKILSGQAASDAEDAGDNADKKAAAKTGSDKAAAALRTLTKLSSALGAALPGVVFAAVKAASDFATAGISNLKPEAAAAAGDKK